MIPLYMGSEPAWYLKLLREDGRSSESWQKQSRELYSKGFPYTEKRSWAEWKIILLGLQLKEGWAQKSWDRYEKLLQKETSFDLGDRESWKLWHHRAHEAGTRTKRRRDWKTFGQELSFCGFPSTLLGKPPVELDADIDVARFEKLLLASPEDIETLKGWIDSLTTTGKRNVDALGNKLVKQYERFPEKEINLAIQEHLKIKTCPYCNAQYLESRTDHRSGRLYTAMQLDHYLPKSQYGLLAMSLYNLVPSCSFCNHTRGDQLLTVSMHHPGYRENDLQFRYQLEDGLPDPVREDSTIRLYLKKSKQGNPLAASLLDDKINILRLGMEDKQDPTNSIIYCQGESEARICLQLIQQHQEMARSILSIDGSASALSEREWYEKCLGLAEDHLSQPFSKLKADLLDQYLMEKNSASE